MSKKTTNIFNGMLYYFEKLYNDVWHNDWGTLSEAKNINTALGVNTSIPCLLSSLENFGNILDNHPDKEQIKREIKRTKQKIEFCKKYYELHSEIELEMAIDSIRYQMEIFQEIEKQINNAK